MTRPIRVHVVAMILGTGVGIVIAALLGPTYVAQSRVIAGQVSAQAAAVPSYATAAQYLAETYSRVIESDRAKQQMVRELGKADSRRTVITASPIPESAIVVVESKSRSEEIAITGANVGAKALTDEVNRLLEEQDRSKELRKRYRLQSLDLERARADLQDARARALPDSSEQAQREVETLQARIATDKVTLDSYAAQLSQTVTAAAAGNSVSPLVVATDASSDILQRLALFGFVGGVVALGFSLLLTRGRQRFNVAKSGD